MFDVAARASSAADAIAIYLDMLQGRDSEPRFETAAHLGAELLESYIGYAGPGSGSGRACDANRRPSVSYHESPRA